MGEPGILPTTFVPGFHDEASVRKMKYSKLGKTDMVVSNYGLGGSSFGDCYTGPPSQLETAKSIVAKSLSSGINYIDTAPFYGQGKSETMFGHILKEVPREAYFIATKVGRYELDIKKMFDFTRERTLTSVRESLDRLKLDYLDLVQVHDVEFSDNLGQIINYTIPALQELKSQGLLRYIGLTSYNVDVLKRLVKMAPPGSVDTVLCYCRDTFFNQDFADSYDFFHARGVGMINASPVGCGILTPGHVPKWHPATRSLKETCARAASYCQEKGHNLAQLSITWSMHRTHLYATTLNSVQSFDLLLKNLESAWNPLTKEEKDMIQELEDKFFNFATTNNWDNLEVNGYWEKMHKGGWKQKIDE